MICYNLFCFLYSTKHVNLYRYFIKVSFNAIINSKDNHFNKKIIVLIRDKEQEGENYVKKTNKINGSSIVGFM